MADEKKIEYVATVECDVYVGGDKYEVRKDTTQKVLAKLYKLGVKEVAIK